MLQQLTDSPSAVGDARRATVFLLGMSAGVAWSGLGGVGSPKDAGGAGGGDVVAVLVVSKSGLHANTHRNTTIHWPAQPMMQHNIDGPTLERPHEEEVFCTGTRRRDSLRLFFVDGKSFSRRCRRDGTRPVERLQL